MTLRLSFLRAMLVHQATGRAAAAAALAFALTGAGLGNAKAAQAAPAAAASAPDAASVSYAAGSQYTVRPGQSLNDVAIAVTQSHDKGTLARASHALFDANPNAFMSHDPSRMRVGATLTVPALDASGALAASAASGAATATGASSSATQAGTAASGVESAASHAGALAAATASASGPTSAAAPAAGSAALTGAAAGVASSAPVAVSQAAASSASDAHAWSGSIQPSASEASASAPATAAAASSAAQPKVSSLQQLLALKNRVLMELQKHGIGGSAAGAAAPATGAPAAAAVGSGHGTVSAPASTDGGMSQQNLSIAAAIGAAMVVLLTALRMRRRKRLNVAAAQAAAADREDSAQEGGQPGAVSSHEQEPAPEVPGDEAPNAAVISTTAAAQAQAEAEREAAGSNAAQPESAESEAENRPAASQAAEERAATEHAAAEQAVVNEVHAEAAKPEPTENHPPHVDTLSQEANLAPSSNAWQERATAAASVEPASAPEQNLPPPVDLNFSPEPLPAHHHDNLDAATTAASLTAAAELGADALPASPLEPVDETSLQEEFARQLRWNREPAPGASAEQEELPGEPQNNQNVPPPVIDFPQQQAESHMIVPPGQPFHDVSDTDDAHDLLVRSAPTMSIPPVPSEFPRDAVDAFGSLDMPLPPRIEAGDDDIHAPSLTTQPVASPETVAHQAVASPEEAAPHIADEITAGTAGPAAVAGLGAAGFGALKLDFDLELPPSPVPPWPAFTQTDLIRIARNKLDLASAYIELGDLSGARVLINEVIEANDPATRNEARALLSTLAPLS